MDDLTETEEFQINACINFVADSVIPALDIFEDVMMHFVKEGDVVASPHLEAMLRCARELVERGWSSDEIVDLVRHVASRHEEDVKGRVVN